MFSSSGVAIQVDLGAKCFLAETSFISWVFLLLCYGDYIL